MTSGHRVDGKEKKSLVHARVGTLCAGMLGNDEDLVRMLRCLFSQQCSKALLQERRELWADSFAENLARGRRHVGTAVSECNSVDAEFSGHSDAPSPSRDCVSS